MSGRGASSYPLERGSHGPMRVFSRGHKIGVSAYGIPIIELNCAIGKLKLRLVNHEKQQSARAIRRFFETVDATRYEVSISQVSIVLRDKIKRTAQTITAENWLTVGLPVKSVLKAMSTASHESELSWGCRYLLEQHQEELQQIEHEALEAAVAEL